MIVLRDFKYLQKFENTNDINSIAIDKNTESSENIKTIIDFIENSTKISIKPSERIMIFLKNIYKNPKNTYKYIVDFIKKIDSCIPNILAL